MRFLCLHGMGTSSKILDLQISVLKTRLGPYHEFIHLEGQHRCAAAPGIEKIFPGPYYCYYDLPTLENVMDAFDLIDDAIENDGPFDGVIGFSQGAAVAASYIHRVGQAPRNEYPFKCAVFMCASMPFNVSDPLPVRVTDDRLFGPKCHLNGTNDQDAKQLEQEMRNLGLGRIIHELEGQSCTVLRRFKASPEQPMLVIPTVHVVGKLDKQYYKHGHSLASICDSKRCWLVEHLKGHEVPRDHLFVNRMVSAVSSVIRLVNSGQ